jgi:mono/diheme cytochrome c family protein
MPGSIARSNSRISLLLFSAVLTLACACVPEGPAATPDSEYSGEAVERGRYLVTVGACNECHTPFAMGPEGPAPDMTRMLSGHPAGFDPGLPPVLTQGWMSANAATNTAFAGPWGVSYAFNLTPDLHTGIGAWTEEIFVETLRTGRHWGVSRAILPPMPWQNYSQMTDEDLRAMYAYLRTIPSIENAVPEPVIVGEVVPE